MCPNEGPNVEVSYGRYHRKHLKAYCHSASLSTPCALPEPRNVVRPEALCVAPRDPCASASDVLWLAEERKSCKRHGEGKRRRSITAVRRSRDAPRTEDAVHRPLQRELRAPMALPTWSAPYPLLPAALGPERRPVGGWAVGRCFSNNVSGVSGHRASTKLWEGLMPGSHHQGLSRCDRIGCQRWADSEYGSGSREAAKV